MLKNRQKATVQRHVFRDTLGRQTDRLQNDLKSEVFDEKTVAMIENIRIICDLKTVLSDVKKKGAIFFGLQNSAKFLSAVRSITGTIDDVSDDDIVSNYRLFLKKLDKHFSKTNARSLTRKDMIRTFLSTATKLYEGIELTVHCMTLQP